MSFLDELNEQQRKAVEYIDGPSLIIAGAGSGKTRVLTYKIVYLLQNGFEPERILALTFTNKAADEMKERMAGLAGRNKVARLWMGTFHSIFARILRQQAELLGYTRNFSIYDNEDSLKLIKQIIDDLDLNDEIYKRNAIFSKISRLKNNLYTPEAYQDNPEFIRNDNLRRIPEFYRIFDEYQRRLKKADAMDFDDLLLNTNILFRDFPEVLRKYQNFFRFILVDEYQDTNFAQYLIIKKLARNHRKICVVGDDSQSIYSFRGARIENILSFSKDFPDYKLFKLEQNYRSTKNIVRAANSLIEKNEKRIPKVVFTHNSEGEKIFVYNLQKDTDEANFTAKMILKLKRQNNYSLKDFAVLYRTNAQSRLFEKYLRQYNINYKIFGSISFYQRQEIKDVLAYLRLVVNPNDDQALLRIINVPRRGIGETTVKKIQKIAKSQNLPLWNVLENITLYEKYFHSHTLRNLLDFSKLIKSFVKAKDKLDAAEFVEEVINKTGLRTFYLEFDKRQNFEKSENIKEFLNDVSHFLEENPQATIEDFLMNVSLRTNEDKTPGEEEDFVSLMTVHSAKGLEFKVVFIAGMEENLFPSAMSMSSTDEIEEERRLFYVALTRAKELLFILYTNYRMVWGNWQTVIPSRFIDEIDRQYLTFHDYKQVEVPQSEPQNFEEPSLINAKPRKLVKIEKSPGTKEETYTENKDYGLKVGMTVRHQKFGTGVILSFEGQGANAKAEVDFRKAGKKKLLLKFARLTVVE